MQNSNARDAAQETKMELTPMIDVTFLLLIFFLCSIQFKVLEGRLQTFLPKEHGPASTPIKNLMEAVEIKVERIASRESLGLDDADKLGSWLRRGRDPNELRITLQGKHVRDIATLSAELQKLRESTPAPLHPAGDDRQPGTADDVEDSLQIKLSAATGVLYTDMVSVVDAAVAEGITRITFQGTDMGS